MKVAVFDIDDTIVEETNFMLRNAPKFLADKYGINVDEVNEEEYDLINVYNLEKHLLNQGLSKDEAREKAREIKKSFWSENFVKYCMSPIILGAKEVIDILKKYGYKIHFVSLRGDTGKNELLLIAATALTKLQLKKGKIDYDHLKLVDSVKEKIEYINSINPDFVFDDQSNVFNSISEKSRVYCISRNHNQYDVLNSNVVRIKDFSSIEIEKILQNTKEEEPKGGNSNILKLSGKIKNVNITNYSKFKRLLTETTYSIITKAGTPIFNHKYHPIIKGKNNLLSNGAVAFVGPHRDKLDPVLVAATSSRSIHWGALLRMFQGKESLFSSTKNKFLCYLSAFLLTSIGTFPIARNTDEDYMNINLNSINTLFHILNEGGAVGLFPEGTINRNVQEQNVLPLKSNRIFRLIKDSNGVVQPFSVVWLPKNLDIDTRVIINYASPINTRNRSVNEIKDLWLNSVNEGIEKSNQFVDSLLDVYNGEKSVSERDAKIKTLVNNFKKDINI